MQTTTSLLLPILRTGSLVASLFLGAFLTSVAADPRTSEDSKGAHTAATLFDLGQVRLLESPFTRAVAADRAYLLELDPDRLLSPFLREAGLQPRKPAYGNWESSGLDGHTGGHYLSALATMIAAGNDKDGELKKRLDYFVSELQRCQKASTNGYVGGVPGSGELWRSVASGNVQAVNRKWVPWYNLHKLFAGLRDAYQLADNRAARQILIGLGDWTASLVSNLSDQQMQTMLDQEHGGMNEVLADIYAITGDQKYLALAKRFNHHRVLDPLIAHQDRLTGLHANTQIPKVIGLERIANLTGDKEFHSGARFFWDNVTSRRSLAFGGNSVSEHFNPTNDFSRVIEHREGPETCNTYNMLRLTEQLFSHQPDAAYADFYERALYNHILASINPEEPGMVYFTPIRPEHYRVYSTPQQCFWCCVGTGIENPGRYGQFIYSKGPGRVYVNLFIPSELKVTNGFVLLQESRFPFEPRTRIGLKLDKPSTFTLSVRHPAWVAREAFVIKVNGKATASTSEPSSYADIARTWKNGDVVQIELPMRTTVERLPDGSDWVALVHGPIVLASPSGTNDLIGLHATDSRMGHVASGPLVPMDKVPVLLDTAEDIPAHVLEDTAAGPLHFRLRDVVYPEQVQGTSLIPFFTLHDSRYQMYWQLTTADKMAARQQELAVAERSKAAREAATLDSVAIGEQQPEVEHDFKGESNTGTHEGRRWRDGRWFQYTLNPRGAKAADLEVTYWGGDTGRTFDIIANGTLLATQELKAEKPGRFFQVRYPLPPELLSSASNSLVTIRFAAKVGVAGGVFDLRLVKPEPVPAVSASAQSDKPGYWQYAPTPPMGWNSWDCFGTTLTESQAREQADAQARLLLAAGYKYFTVDIQWYEPESRGHDYKPGAPLEMDAFSRLMPAVKKFPSAADGAGFQPLADYIHSKGLKFGIHIMRGIARQAVKQNTPIKNTNARAADIANTNSTCAWNPDMYGVDMRKSGAQEYYDSLLELYASWGVDFVKCDDIARPYDRVQMAEIEAIRKAIDKTGRPIVLSLSPGDTPIQRGDHVMQHANMWRISDDFWDRWEPLHGMFGRLEKWTPYRAQGAWPDADMLPFGIVEFKRPTRFTTNEQFLCMTLWCIARSPLILGADMTKLDEFTLNLLTNREVLAANQSSTANRQLSRNDDLVVWSAEVRGSPDRYVALFNAQSKQSSFDLSQAAYKSAVVRGSPGAQTVPISVALTNAHRLVLAIGEGGNDFSFDHAAWIDPVLTGPKGTLKLTDLDWSQATAGWGQTRKNRTADNQPLRLNGQPVNGIGSHATSIIEFENLPAGYDTFTARGVLTEGSQGKGSVQFLVLVDPPKRVAPDQSPVQVSLADLGIEGKARVRDLWAGKDLGEVSATFARDIPLHGAGLYRISPVAGTNANNP